MSKGDSVWQIWSMDGELIDEWVVDYPYWGYAVTPDDDVIIEYQWPFGDLADKRDSSATASRRFGGGEGADWGNRCP